MRALRLAAALALLAPAAAFAFNTSEIQMDGAAVLPSLGLTIDVAGESSLRRASRTSHALELGWIGARGKDKQELGAGDRPIVFGGETFAGPQDLRYTANIRFADLVYRYRHFFGQSSFALEGMGGVGWASLGLTAVGATQSAAERFSNAGFVLGIGALWRFLPGTALHARVLGMGSGREEGVTNAGRFEASLVHSLGEHAAVRVGVGSVGVRSAREDDRGASSTNSPIRASLGGLTAGFELLF